MESLYGWVRRRIPRLRLQPLGICFNVVRDDVSALLLRDRMKVRLKMLEEFIWFHENRTDLHKMFSKYS